MSTNNVTTNFTCPYADWYASTVPKVFFSTYFILMPIYFVVGTFTHGLCLHVFRKEAKKEPAYQYQAYLTFVRLLRSLFALVHQIPQSLWNTPTSPGPNWYRACYPCMLYLAYFSGPLSNNFVTICEMLSILISVDRFYALWKPIAYQVYGGKWNKQFAVLCVGFSILLNIPQCIRFLVTPINSQKNPPLYQLATNFAFTTSMAGNILIQIKNIAEGSGVVVLYVCNVGMLWFFRQRRIESSKKLLTNSQARKRQEMEITLALLAIFQSIISTITVTHRLIYFTFLYFDPTFATCKSQLQNSIITATNAVMDLADFFSVFVISKQFRKMLKDAMLGRKAGNTVEPTPMGRGRSDQGRSGHR